MHEKTFRGVFALVLAMCGFCGLLVTATMMFDEPSGFGLMFRLVVCAGLAVMALALFVLDLFGIWTGDLPHWHHKKLS